MGLDHAKVRELLDELARAPRAQGAVQLDPRYLEAIDRLEGSEQSRPGTDKSWVLTTLVGSRRLLATARRVR